MIIILSAIAIALIALTIRTILLDGYGRIPDRSEHRVLRNMSVARHPRRDLRTS